MTVKKACLVNDIEKIRGELNRLIFDLDVNAPEVLKLSQELDTLISSYENTSDNSE